MLRLFKSFLKDKQGTSTIEFVLTIAGYFFVVLMILEFGRLALSSAYWDLAVTEAVYHTKNQIAKDSVTGERGNYKILFEEELRKKQAELRKKSTGFFAVQENSFNVDVKYANNLKDLINGNYRKDIVDNAGNVTPATGDNAAIAEYTLEYDYNFITSLPFLPSSWTKGLFGRKVIAVQEYEK